MSALGQMLSANANYVRHESPMNIASVQERPSIVQSQGAPVSSEKCCSKHFCWKFGCGCFGTFVSAAARFYASRALYLVTHHRTEHRTQL
jgi:hypothetical protein